jgi:hypothetical protein
MLTALSFVPGSSQIRSEFWKNKISSGNISVFRMVTRQPNEVKFVA